ncbi:Probable RNA-directed DNA polymerase from transposon X-element [Eumeta japonica]|uniref:Probable RNA-directed DNA polymerase from transposon X-element n=1 Tax=Eumeta variegata TaxID=151549 RepID=A0A4C1UMD2_EUMVA|nr:Probable RNA-directed DNA polymerase from transposon X-element [Eumeta japonica]
MNIISTGQPTYWPTDKDKIPDIVDFCIFKGIANTNISCSSCWDLSSDHSPILVEITAEIRETTRRCTLHNKRTNWPLFRALTDEAFSVPIALQTKGDIVDAVEYFTTSVQSAAWNSTPINQHKLTEQHIPTNILQKISEKRALRKLWQQNRCPETKKRLNHKIKELKRILNNDRNVGSKRTSRVLIPPLLPTIHSGKQQRK